MGFFNGTHLVDKHIIASGDLPALKSLCQKRQIKKGIVSHSGKPFFTLNDLGCAEGGIWLNHTTPLPIVNKYKTPETLGKDRLAAVVGGWFLSDRRPCLVIDAGTCITYDFISGQGEYLGGNIAPGLEMRYEAMHTFTHALPKVEKPTSKREDQYLGDDTQTALQLGGVIGIENEIKGYRKALKKSFGKINIILTGGDAEYLAGRLKTKIFVYPDLVLFGLIQILGYQNQFYE